MATAQNLCTAKNTNGDSTIVQRGAMGGSGAVVITSTIGATPTVTVNIQGSVDEGASWFNVPYALVATPSTFAVTAIVITTAVTTNYLLQPNQPWTDLKIVLSADTNVTLTADAYLT